MSWYIAQNFNNECFPVFMTETGLEIPHQNVNSKFYKDGWTIMETLPLVSDNEIKWETRIFCQLVSFQKMTCLPDIDHLISLAELYLGKTLIVDDVEYHLTILKQNDYRGAIFESKTSDGSYTQIRFDNYKFYYPKDGQWVMGGNLK
jgi:hypothetical protein